MTWNAVSEKDDCFAEKEVRFKKFVPMEKIVQVESRKQRTIHLHLQQRGFNTIFAQGNPRAEARQ